MSRMDEMLALYNSKSKRQYKSVEALGLDLARDALKNMWVQDQVHKENKRISLEAESVFMEAK